MTTVTATMNAGFPNPWMAEDMVPCVLKERQDAQGKDKGKGKISAELQERYDLVYPENESGFRIVKGEKYEVADGLRNAQWVTGIHPGDKQIPGSKRPDLQREKVSRTKI